MADENTHPAIHRIEAAIARIERAAGARAFEADQLGRRHMALRARMAEAIEALDAVIEQETAAGGDA